MTATEQAAFDWAVRELIAFRVSNPDPYHAQPPAVLLPLIEAAIFRIVGVKP